VGETWEIKQYRNYRLRNWIKATFHDDHDEGVAWKVVAFIKDTWPETVPVLRGEEVK
jgi:hypothetical protein